MFYVIRNDRTKEVLGIFSQKKLLTPSEHQGYVRCNPLYTCGCCESRLRGIINADIGHDDKWTWEQITQSEYETFRDLHGFKVIKRDR